MGTTESTTLTVRREEGGKIRVTSNLWDNAKVIGKDEVLEVRKVDGRLNVARMPRFHNDWDPPIEAYDPYGPGTRGDDDIRATMFGRRGCCRCNHKRNAEKDCNCKRDLSHLV